MSDTVYATLGGKVVLILEPDEARILAGLYREGDEVIPELLEEADKAEVVAKDGWALSVMPLGSFMRIKREDLER